MRGQRSGWTRRDNGLAVTAVCCFLGHFGAWASAAELALEPIRASGVHSIVGREISLAGGGQRVILDLHLLDWAPGITGVQAQIDASGFTSGLYGTLEPAVEPCTSSTECIADFGNGALCNAVWGPPDQCTPGFNDCLRANYICRGTIGCPEVADFGYLCATASLIVYFGPAYCGTAVLDVPPDAIGTFTVEFVPKETAVWDENGQPIEPLLLSPALITVLCQDHTDCDDGNACTDDLCQADGTCGSTDTFNPAVDCCDPADGTTTPLSDGRFCTTDVCNADGSVDHTPRVAGTPCGSQSSSACDNANACDGAGNCQPNYVAAGTPCGDPADTDCTDPDTCDGAGRCQANDEPDGTPCGAPPADECTAPDTCDGAGACLAAFPQVVSEGSRHLAVTPQDLQSQAAIALRVTSPDWPCLDKYVDQSGRLVTEPVALFPDEWGRVVVQGQEIVPDSTYVVVAECGKFVSAAGSATTSILGDNVGVFTETDWPLPDGAANLQDINAALLRFANVATAPLMERVDVSPCTPDGRIDLGDLFTVIFGFNFLKYEQVSGCPLPCP